MHDRNSSEPKTGDPLAEIIRAAGRRTVPPKDHYDQVYSAARAAWRQKLKSRRQRRWFALAASLLAVGSAALLFGLLTSVEPVEAARFAVDRGTVEWFSEERGEWIRVAGADTVVHAGTRVRTGSDGMLALELIDGGSLRLDSATEVVLGTSVQSLESGRLYFDSSGRAGDEPIEVLTRLGAVREVGTQFEARLALTSLRVRVREGQIALQQTGAATDLVLQAGEELEWSERLGSRMREIEPDDPEWDWVQALASAPETRSILVYLRWIARETGKRLEFDPPTVELDAEFASFTGNPSGYTPQELLEQIEAVSNFVFRTTDDRTILIRRNDDP